MKVDTLKKLIKEAVKEAIREELGDRTKPVQEQSRLAELKSTGNPITDMLNMTRQTMTNEEYRNVSSIDSSTVPVPDFRSLMTGGQDMPTPRKTLANAPKVGLDISNLDFVKKAASVYKQAEAKSKAKMI